MNLTVWNPLKEIEEIFDHYNRGLRTPLRGREELTAADWSPAIDVVESDKEFLVRAELPGIKKDEVKVKITDNVLRIEGERKIEKTTKDEKYHRVERFYGCFSRSFTLPENVRQDQIKADFKDGLLTVHLEKVEKAKPKSVDIEIAA